MKRTLSLLLCISLIAGLLPVTALAEEGALETPPAAVSEDVPAPIAEDAPSPIANDPGYTDAQVNHLIEISYEGGSWGYTDGAVDDEAGTKPQGVDYDDNTHTLTLDNATLNTIEIINWGSAKFTIVVKGANTVKPANGDAGADGIFIANCHDVTIQGEDSGAKLTVEPTPGEGQVYGTPLILSDAYISDNPEGDDFHPYPDGSLTIEGVELVLTNNEKSIENAKSGHASAFNALGNVTLQNGAKITAKGLQGIDAKGSFTIGAGCTVETDALNISGFDGYDEGGGNVRKLTVDGTLKINGAMNGATDAAESDWWWPSLWIRASAQLVLNSTGVVTVHSTYHGTGEAISLDHTDWNDEMTPDYLIPAEAHINGGTLTVEDVKADSAGIVLNAGTKWVQTAGDVTVKTVANVNSGPSGIAISGDAEAKSAGYDIDPASFEQSGGTVTVDFSNVNIPGDENHYGVVCVTNSGFFTLSGDAKFNVTLSGTDNHWGQGVQTRMEDENGVVLPQTTPTMTVKDSAALTVDMSGLSGTGNDSGFLGLNVENCALDIAGGTVTVKLPGTGKTANGVNGIQASSSKLNISGGKVDITENGGTLGELRGITLGKYNWEDENSPASEFTMSGGSVNISLKPAMQDDVNLCGISNWDDGTASITGGAVTIDVTGALSSEQEHYNNLIWGIESTGESLTIRSGATVDITGGFTGTYTYERKDDYDPDGWLSFHGIDVREGSTYAQSGEVSIKPAAGNNPATDSYGLDAENRSTVTVTGKLTIGDGILTGIYINSYTTLQIGSGANIVYNTNGEFATGIAADSYSDILISEGSKIDFDMNEAVSDGISAWTYSNITITGGTIDIDMPMLPGTEDGFWLAGGFWLDDHSTLSVSGHTTININQKAGRTVPETEFSSYGIIMRQGSYMRVSGGTMNITAAAPVYWTSEYTQPYSGHISFADGIRAVYTDEGDNNGREVTVYNAKMHEDPDDPTGWFEYYVYIADPNSLPEVLEDNYGEVANHSSEFSVCIKSQNAKPAKYNYSGLLELVNPGTITAGQSVTLRMTATLPDGADTLTLAIDNGTIERGSVSVNGAVPTADNHVSYSSDGKSVTLTINSGDIVRFNVIPGNGENTVTATVATTEGSEKPESVTFTAKALSLELPTATQTPTITVSGVAAADSTVTIYVDGTATTTATANKAGVWSTTVTLTSTGEHKVQARTGGISSEEKAVVYDPVIPTIGSLTVRNHVHGRTSADPDEETSFTIHYVSSTVSPRYYIYWPELPKFLFEVEVAGGTIDITGMRIICTDWKGDRETIVLEYDHEHGVWIGEGEFCGLGSDGKEHIVPEHFRVEYDVPDGQGTKTYSTPDSNRPSSCGDPSGFVYEGLESNRLSGVTTTLYKADNANGTNSAAWTEAKDFDQQNPLTTDRLGQYLWMVPNGYWQVKYEKAGYTTQTSAWMVVPPARTGVNQNLTSTDPATASIEYVKAENAETGQYIIRFNRPVQVSSVLKDLHVDVNLTDYDYAEFEGLTPVDSGWADTGSSGIDSTLCATTFTASDISAYKYVEGSDDESVEIPSGTEITISGEIPTYMDTASKIEATCKAVTVVAVRQSFCVTVTNGSGSGTYTEGETVAVSAEIRAGYTFSGWTVESTKEITGLNPKSNPASFTMPACDVTLTAQYEEVKTPAESGGSSSSGTFRPSRPAETFRTGVTSPRETGVSETLDVTGSIAYIQGFPDGTMRPDQAVTRAEAVQMIYRLVADKPAAVTNPFKDVKDGDWFREAALGLAAMGVIKGKNSADTFVPGDIMTRAEFAAMCARLAVETDAPKTFTDVPADHWAAKEIGAAAAYGWINGRDGSRFDPNAGITRAEAAKIINCMIGRAPVTSGADVTFKDLSPNHWAYGEILAAARGN